ncbi:hypothetical protein Tamer19_69800 [Cupriavidus sp. TA19]|nr:hypothetical protein Tamer19_69800 [Cupriavidus sp. TA19]
MVVGPREAGPLLGISLYLCADPLAREHLLVTPQAIGYVDSVGRRCGLRRFTAGPGQASAFIGKHGVEKRLDAVRENVRARKGAGSSTRKSWPMRGRLPASSKNESASAPNWAGKRRHQQFDCQRGF